MTSSLIYIFSDQLSLDISSLSSVNKEEDVIVMCELDQQMTSVKHHKQKIAYWLSTMRHFAEKLKNMGFTVYYVTIDDKDNTHNFCTELMRAVKFFSPHQVIVTEPCDWQCYDELIKLKNSNKLTITVLPDDRFFCSRQDFHAWARGKSRLLMEYFYRDMRKKYRILVDEKNNPIGGQWNYDKENRQPPTAELTSPTRVSHKKSDIVLTCIELVRHRYADHIGNLDRFYYAVTAEQAYKELQHFVDYLLPHFGAHQDAMKHGEVYLYHSLLSSYINSGLLLPKQVCDLVVTAFHSGRAPLNSVEGFIRQILGWREYIKGMYWLFMPDYQWNNALHATRPLPRFYWDGKTDMRCLSEVVHHTVDHAYSHHIQRLMITGNFALLAGLDVREVHEWYLAVYTDAYEWVELPNTLGMALFADGGVLASKPYAASGKYIDRMSNFCKGCRYNVQETTEETACPFNSLYWRFIHVHKKLLSLNQRMTYMYTTWNKFSEEKKQLILKRADHYLQRLKINAL